MESKLISVIMPAYNCDKYVRIAIDSVLNQTYTNLELLIADDCSTDSTRKIIDSYEDSRIKRFHNSKNLGYLKTCNLLAAKATGDYLTFLDADDINSEKRFELQINFLQNNPKIACVGCNIYGIDSYGNELFKSDFSLKHEEIVRAFDSYKTPCHYSTFLIKKNVVDEIGLYNDYFDRIGSEDAYWFSFVIEKYKVENLPEWLYFYRKHPMSITATHKNPKATVGYQLTLWLYKNRQENKTDYIQSGQWGKADLSARFLLATNQINKSRSAALRNFSFAFIKSPGVGMRFLRYFVSHFRHHLKTNEAS